MQEGWRREDESGEVRVSGWVGAPGGHISFDLFQKVFLITFLLPLLPQMFQFLQHRTGGGLFTNKT